MPTETRARLQTELGDIVIRFLPELAPKHVANFTDLARRGWYDGKTFHRVKKNFMIQGGCAVGNGTGKHPDGKTIPAEFSKRQHTPGTVSMARSKDPNSAGSQFFICHGKHSPHLDGSYSAFGEVVSGMDVLEKIANVPVQGPSMDQAVKPVVIKKITLEEAAL